MGEWVDGCIGEWVNGWVDEDGITDGLMGA